MCLQLDSTTKPELKAAMGVYFARMQKLRENTMLDSRIRFMIQDVLDLRNTKWVPRTKKEGPKKIEVRQWFLHVSGSVLGMEHNALCN